MAKRKNKKKVRIFSRVLSFLALIVLVLFLLYLYKVNILPMKYFIAGAGVLGFLELIYLSFALNKRIKIGFLIFMDIIAIIAIAAECFAGYKIYQTYKFIDDDMKVEETKDVYYIVVNSESKFSELKSIENKIVYYYDDTEGEIDKLKQCVTNKVSVIFNEVENYDELLSDLSKNKEKIILINEGSYSSYIEENVDIQDKYKTLGEVELVKEVEVSSSDEDITTKPFTFYISGIDTRTKSMPSRSLSDVNMFIVVNPTTRKILMVGVPRDYYVQLHGKKGLKDKLTHAGIVGGLKLSKSTVEDIMDTKADYYARVNFQAVIKLVDAVGGITIYNDQKRSFRCWTDSGCVFKPGNNKVGGRCALAFARERHAYTTGDRHRGENQQQVIRLIVEKLTSSKSLVANYDKILKALNGSFETNLSTANITSLVQFQLNDMRGWNFITSNLDGTSGNAPTYSYPKSSLSVMYPNQKTIDTAKAKIKEIMSEGY